MISQENVKKMLNNVGDMMDACDTPTVGPPTWASNMFLEIIQGADVDL